MARLTGSDGKVGFKIASTLGTAVAVGANDGLCHGGVSMSVGVERQEAASLGCGLSMLKDVKPGAKTYEPTVSATTPQFNCAEMSMLAVFMGAAVAGVEQTTSQGDYLHVIHFNKTRKFGTLAYEASTTKVIEFPSTYIKEVTIQPKGVPGYLQIDYKCLATSRVLNSSTNTNATIASNLTRPSDEQVEVLQDADIWIADASGGSLSSSNKVNIKNFNLTLTRDAVPANEITGTNVDAAPVDQGYFSGTLTLDLSGLDDFTWFDFANAETFLKAKLGFEGSQIGTGDNRSFNIYLPRLKLVEDPKYDITDAGFNPHNLTFEVLAAVSAPTGMSYTLPYFEVTNEYTGDYIA